MGSTEIKARLDRARACGDWLVRFPKARVDHIGTAISDHFLLLIELSAPSSSNRRKPFRFEPMWLRCTEFIDQVSIWWPSTLSEGSSLHTTLTACTEKLSVWNRNSFGCVQKKLKELRCELEEVKKKVRTHASVEEESRITTDLDE